MSINSNDSGLTAKYQLYADDDTKPKVSNEPSSTIPDYLLRKLDSNMDSIKGDVNNIKYKIDIDHRMIISDIAIGVVSSLIVSIIILFVSTNIGSESIEIFELEMPVFVLFVG